MTYAARYLDVILLLFKKIKYYMCKYLGNCWLPLFLYLMVYSFLKKEKEILPRMKTKHVAVN